MAQLDSDQYIRLTPEHTYGRSDGLYWDKTNSLLVLVINDAIVFSIDSAGAILAGALEAPDLNVSGQARGDMLRRGASAWEVVTAKTSGQILVGDGTDVVSVAVSGDVALTGAGVATVTDLTIASEARGDIVRRNASAWGRLSAKDSGKVLIGDGTDVTSQAVTGDVTISGAAVTAIGTEKVLRAMLGKPRIGLIKETVTAASLTDGGGASGTKVMTASIPAGARFLNCLITAVTGFAGDVSAVITVGDGSDVDRYNTGTPSVFATSAQGQDMGAPSGTAWHTSAVTPTVTITSNADITPVISGGGSVDVTLAFIEPI